MKKFLNWLGHPSLGALTAVVILYINPVVGALGFIGFALYQIQEFREIQRLLKQGKTLDDHLGDRADSFAKDFRDYLEGFYFWAIIETVRRIILWIPGLF